MPYLPRANANLYYETLGETGPWLTFICGITRSLEDYRHYSRKFQEQGYRILLFDNRGAGKTEWEPDFNFIDMAEDCCALWDHLRIEQSHLIGFSLGGLIALETALLFPKRVAALLIVSSGVYADCLNRGALLGLNSSAEEIEERIPLYFSKKYREKHLLFVSAFAKKLIREHFIAEKQTGAEAQRRAMESSQVEKNFAKITSPVLLVHGSSDAVVSVESSRRVHNVLKSSKLVEIPEAGHMLLIEEPEKLFKILNDYLSSLAVQ